MSLRNTCLRAAAVTVAMGVAGIAKAGLIVDQQPPMTWDGLMACELVVVGHYDSHQPGTLTIKVDKVLKGAAKQDDLIDVKLEHWWTVETGPVSVAALAGDGKSDGKPRLCYQSQIMNPGPLVPMPVLEKEEPALFFFPGKQGVLDRKLQVLPASQADGWRQALTGKPMDLTFRLAQKLNPKLSQDALQELKANRDKQVIGALIEKVVKGEGPETPARRLFQGTQPLQLLIDIGDKNGDVYDRVRAEIDAAVTRTPPWPAYALAEALASVDPKRAMKELEGWIHEPPPHPLKNAAVNALAWVGTEESLDLAIGMIRDKESGDTAVMAVRMMIGERWRPWPNTSPEQRRKLWQYATERMTDPTPPAHLSEQASREYRWLIERVLMAGEPPR